MLKIIKPHKLTWTLSSRSPTMIACPWRPQCRTRTMARAWWTPRTKRSRPAQLRHRSTAPGPSARQGESHQQANRRVATFLFRSVSRPRRKFQIGRRRIQNRERSKTSSLYPSLLFTATPTLAMHAALALRSKLFMRTTWGEIAIHHRDEVPEIFIRALRPRWGLNCYVKIWLWSEQWGWKWTVFTLGVPHKKLCNNILYCIIYFMIKHHVSFLS